MDRDDDLHLTETLRQLVCGQAALVGIALLLAAWHAAGPHRLLLGAVGAALAFAGSWFSGLFHDAGDDPWKR